MQVVGRVCLERRAARPLPASPRAQLADSPQSATAGTSSRAGSPRAQVTAFGKRIRFAAIDCFGVAIVLGVLVLLTTLARPAAAQAPQGPGILPLPNPAAAQPPDITPQQPQQDLVVDVRIEGNKSISAQQVLGNLATRAGRPFDERLVQEDVRKLDRLGWFLDIRPWYERVAGGRVVVFRVVERPRLRYVQYQGNEEIADKHLAKQTGLKVDAALDPYAVDDGRRKLEEFYQSKGYNQARITVLEGNKVGDQGAIYLIHEGKTQRIWRTEFIGNSAVVSDARLKTIVHSKPGILWLFRGHLDHEQMDQDVDRITAYYRSLGFFSARVGRERGFNPSGEWATIRYVIDEGQRYGVRSVSFTGNQKFQTQELATNLELDRGEYFNQATLEKDVNRLRDFYGSLGYAFADIQAQPQWLEEPGWLDIVYQIKEGKRYRVGQIYVHIKGENPHTRVQTVLNRLSLRPGDIIDIRKIREDERRLRASQIFATDPARGNPPRIVIPPPQIDDLEVADGTAGGSMRSQSPDGTDAHRARFRPAQQGASGDGVETIDLHLYGEWKEASDGAAERSGGPPSAAAGGTSTTQLSWSRPEQPDAIAMQQAQRHPGAGYTAGRPAAQRRAHSVPGHASVQPTPERPAVTTSAPSSNQPAPAQHVPNAAVHAVHNEPPSFGGQGVRAVSPVEQSVYMRGAPSPAYRGQSPGAYPPNYPNAYPPQGYPPAQTAPRTGPFSGPPLPAGEPYPYANGAPGAAAPPPGTNAAPAQNPSGAGGQFQLFPDPYYEPLNQPTTLDPSIPLTVELEETQTGRLMMGVGVNSNLGVVGSVVIDEQNFDWRRFPTSFEDIRNGTAWRGAGQRFRMELVPGTQVQRYLVSFQEPYLWDTPITFGLSGFFYDRRYFDWDEQRIGGRVSLGYQLTPDLSTTISYRGEQVGVHDVRDPTPPPELLEVLGDNALHGFKWGLAHDTRDNPYLATQGHLIEGSVEQVVGDFEYPRAEFNASQYFLIHERPDFTGRHVLSLSTQLGFSGNDTPVYDHFFAGGFSTLRGFDFRGASPRVGDVIVGGEFMWVNTAEYLFPITADDMLRGVVFCDFGTVERDIEINDFRIAPGVGLRVTVPALGPAPIALDFAFALNEAAFDDTQVFSFNVGWQR